MNYRILEVSEIIEAGDEFYAIKQKRWILSFYVSGVVTNFTHGRYRRPISTT